MKITIARAALHQALGLLRNVAEKRNTIPILACVVIETVSGTDGVVRLTATDMEFELSVDVAATVERAGAAAVPAGTLFDIVTRQANGAMLTLERVANQDLVSIKTGRNSTVLNSLPVGDFPEMTGKQARAVQFAMPTADMMRLMDKTRFAMSSEATRHYLCGFYLHIAPTENGPVLRAVATDGHRLARIDVPFPAGAEAMPGVIVPRRVAIELRKIIETMGDRLEFAVSESRLMVSAPGYSVTSKLVDGSFPDYGRVIPSDNNCKLTIDRRVFFAAVGRVVAVSSERSRAVKVEIGPDRLVLSHVDSATGSAVEEVEPEAFHYAGTPITTGYQARYLADIGDVLGEKVEISLSDYQTPALLRDPDDPGDLFLIMPMRV
jgi:DNA polymerase-3 subunit beta